MAYLNDNKIFNIPFIGSTGSGSDLYETKEYTTTNKYYFEGNEDVISLAETGINNLIGNSITNAYKLKMAITEDQLNELDEFRLVNLKNWDNHKITLSDNAVYEITKDKATVGYAYNADFGAVVILFEAGESEIKIGNNSIKINIKDEF